MKSTKVIQFFATLTPVELNRFDKFVHSPYFNVHTDTTRLFDVLKAYHPEFKENQITKEKVFKKLFPKRAYDEAKLYTLNKYLLNLITDFLVFEDMLQDRWGQKILSGLEVLSQRRLDKFIPRLLKETQSKIEHTSGRNADYFHLKFRLSEFETSFSLSENNRSHTVSYREAMENLDYFYLIQKLKYVCSILNQKQTVAFKEEIQLLDQIEQFCSQGSLP